MSDLIEVAVISDSGGRCSSTVWDPRTATCVQTYKGGNILSPKTLQFIGKDYLIAAERLKPLLHVWPVNSQESLQELRIVCAGIVQALSVSPNGLYCAAGIAEKLYVWLICSGKLLAVASKHYQPITCVKFTDDGNFIMTSGEDGIILVWRLYNLIQKSCPSEPYYSFIEHSLSITDMHVTAGGVRGRLASVSLDRTCKIFDLRTGELLNTIVFDKPLSSVVMDVFERKVYVGTVSGDIYDYTINNQVKVNDFSNRNRDTQFVGHTDTVNCLSINLDGQILLSGSKDGTVRFWNLESKLNLRNVEVKHCITNAFFTIASGHLFKTEFKPEIIIKKFQRSYEEKDNPNFFIEVLTSHKQADDELIPDPELVFQNEVVPMIEDIDKSEKYSNMKRANQELFKLLAAQLFADSREDRIPHEGYQKFIKNLIEK